MDIASGLSAASQALNIASWLKQIGKDYDAAEYKMKIAELVDALSDAKLALSEAKDAAFEQKKEIDALKASFETKSKLIRGAGDYLYFSDENDHPLGFPVCPACELEGHMAQLKQNGGTSSAKCPRCKTEYSPVSCFLPSGSGDTTLHDQELRLKRERRQRQQAQIDEINRRNAHWMR